ncbi:MAG: ATP-dependent helicase [Thermoplasmata archaeon]
MLIRDNEQYDLDQFLDPIVEEWFMSKYNQATKAQRIGIPLIHQRKNVLISSPTGTGKTLSGFMVIINELFLLAKRGKLEDRIYCVYVSPLKALANDIHRNLEVPLEEIRELAISKGINIPKIRVGVRSGDTSQYARQKMNKTPPHIFITTPESLALSLFSPKFKEKFRQVDFLIVDEIHDLASNKRGELLSLIIEFLQYNSGNLTRIGLSATTEPIDEIARFLIGNEKEKDVHIIEVESNKNLDMKVVCPVSDLYSAPQEQINERSYDIIEKLVNDHKTTLVFTNTRSGAERVSSKLIERGILSLEAHHSSLSKESRFNVEEKLKKGELKCAVSSTSLELGIDIGSIDLVVQVGSPKGIAKGLQRVGRSGHSVFATAKGRIIPMDIDDLVESLVLVKMAKEKKLDRITIPKNSLDILSQFIVGISLEKKWEEREALELVRRSYCYNNLKENDFVNVLNYLSGGFEEGNVYSKIWWDKKEKTFGRKKSSRLIYFTNAGTIPEEADYEAFSVDNRHLGSLSEKFVEKLHRGDIFVLGAKTYEFLRMRGNKIFIKDASGRKPTVPSWAGEMLPRTFDLSVEIGRFREEIVKKINEGIAEQYLRDYYDADENSIRSVISYFTSQMGFQVPSDKNIYIEGYIDRSNQYSVIFHFVYGRRVNDALSRIIAYNISKVYSVNSRIALTDDGFMLTFNRKIEIEGIKEILKNLEVENSLRRAVKSTELFKQRFRHCATRSFMVLRRYRGREVSVARQQLRSEKVLDILFSMENFPIIEETFREIETIVMDVENARKIAEGLKNGEIKIISEDYSKHPSPFSFGIISTGISDVVLMEDKSAIIKELQESLLTKMGLEGSLETNPEDLINYQDSKLDVSGKEGLIEFLRKAGFSDLYSTVSFSPLKKVENQDEYLDTVSELLGEGIIQPVFTGKTTYALTGNVPILAAVYSQKSDLKLIFDDGESTNTIARKNGLDPEEALIILRKMERAYEAYFLKFGNRVKWFHRSVKKDDTISSIKEVVKWLLWQNGPLTIAEISDRIGEREEMEEVIESLLSERIISTGRFLPKPDKQYILTEDLKNLKIVGQGEISVSRISRSLLKRDGNYFDNYLFALDGTALRARGYDESEMHSEEIVYGNFTRNVKAYFPLKLLPQLITLNRVEMIDVKSSVINEGGKIGGVKNKDDKLEENLMKNNYLFIKGNAVLSAEEYAMEEPVQLLEKFIDAYGPISLRELENFFGKNVDNYIGKLNVKRLISGHDAYLYTNLEPAEQRSIINSKDPVYLLNRERIEGEVGEGINYILIENGLIKLGIEVASDNGILEIFDMTGEYSGEINQVKNMIDYISGRESFDSLLIRKITFPIPDEKIIAEMGYQKVRGFLVLGGVKDVALEEEEIISYILKKYHLVKNEKYSDPVVALQSILGFKNNQELMMKSHKFIDLEKLVMSNLAVQGFLMDGSSGYLNKENLSLIGSLKFKGLSENSRRLYEIIRKHSPVAREVIIEKSCFTINQTINIINELMRNDAIFKDHKGKYVAADTTLDPFMSLDKITREIGIFNGRVLSNLLDGSVDQKFISSYLSQGVNGGKFTRILPLKSRDEIFYSWSDEDFRTDFSGEDLVLFPRSIVMTHLSSLLGWKSNGKFIFIRDGIEPIFFKGKKSKERLLIQTPLRDETKRRISKYLLGLNISTDTEEGDEMTQKWYENMVPKKYR